MDFHGWMVGLATRVPFSGLCTRAWQGAMPRCGSRRQCRSQCSATGLANPGEGLGGGATCDYSSGHSALQRVWQGSRPGPDSRPQFRCVGLCTRARPRGDWDLQLRSQFSVAGLARVWAAGCARDCSSGFRPPCVSLQWLSFSAQGPEHTSYDVAAPCHVHSVASVAHESSH